MKTHFILLSALTALTHILSAEEKLPCIEWQRESLCLVAESGNYGRMIRLKNKEILCCYQRAGQCRVKRSPDEGKTWKDEVCVTSYDKGIAASPELLQMKNGRVMLCYNERPDDTESHYTIMTRFSSDNGNTWGRAIKLFEAGRTFADGCGEPALLQYPDGEIQVFFANESAYTYSDEQEISVISSTDNGNSWQGPGTISFRSGHRDGMPVPCLLSNGTEIVVVIEDTGLCGTVKPVVLRDFTLNRWKRIIIKGNSPRRQSALLRPLPADIYAGAPYIRQMPSGITVLSVQSRERKPNEEPAVYVGNRQARNFTNRTFPLDLDEGIEGSWNSLFVKNSETITLVSTATINGHKGIWAIDGKFK
ncbi:MAG: sialidase family protein [Kiritimatiellia bacterium]